MFRFLVKKEEHKRKYMKLRSMRSLLFLLFACLMITVPVAAFSGIELSSHTCSGDGYAGLPGGTGLAVVELSGHGDILIDGQPATPVGVGTYEGYTTQFYAAGEGSHTIFIDKPGYFNFSRTLTVCSGKVSYMYYDLASHHATGMIITTATTAAVAPATTVATTTVAGQSTEYGALRDALRTTAPSGSFGSLSVTTDPAGATIFIDGVQQGISPATISGLSAGSHTLLLKRDGYQDLTLPVTIIAGSTQYYSSALLKSGEVTMGTTIPRKSSMPGFEALFAACGVCALLLLRKNSS
jgi:hypothetical protein